MPSGYLILPSEQRIMCIMFDDGLNGLRQAIDCRIVEHGTTFYTEDQLLVDGDQVNLAKENSYTVAGVPFPFSCNALLVGTDPRDGETANHPVMSIEEFRRLITFRGGAYTGHSATVRARARTSGKW